MIDPPFWTREQLEENRLKAIAIFRQERMEEPLEDYLRAFDKYQAHVRTLLETTVDLAQLRDQALDVLSDNQLQAAFRYLAAPPISDADLKVVAEASSLSKRHLQKNPDEVRRLVETVLLVLDRRRFAWLREMREPTEAEKGAAIMASAALMAVSRVQTDRRNTGKKQQEDRVKEVLIEAGWTEVKRRTIPNVSYAPDPGEFCGESLLGVSKSDGKSDKGRLADIVLRLWDHRLMPIECKVSNSSLNSVKRLNNDAAVKAATWKRDFGLHQVVPTAVLSGVYDLHNLLDAQARGLTILWAHDLKPLTDWIVETKI